MQALEAAVNAWMEADRPRIRHMNQSIRDQHILLSFVYEEGRELEGRVAVQAQTGALPRFFDEEFLDDRPTNPHIPATTPIH